jgi:hypothetical protein
MSSGIMTIILSTTNKTSKVYTLGVSDIMLNSVHIVSRITNGTISLTPQIAKTAPRYLNIQTRSTGMIVDVRSIVRNFNLSLIHNRSRDLGPVVLIKGRSRSVATTIRDVEQIAEPAIAFVTASGDVWMQMWAGSQVWRVWVCDEGGWFRGCGAVARIRIGGSVLVGHFFVGLKVAPEFCYAAVGIVVFHVHCQAVQLSWWRHGCSGEKKECWLLQGVVGKCFDRRTIRRVQSSYRRNYS